MIRTPDCHNVLVLTCIARYSTVVKGFDHASDIGQPVFTLATLCRPRPRHGHRGDVDGALQRLTWRDLQESYWAASVCTSLHGWCDQSWIRHRGTHDGTYSSAVLRSSCATGDGKFAFVEFATPEMASAGLSLNGLMLHGRPLRVGRPQVRCICTPVVFIGSHLVPRRVECIQLGHRCDLIAGICAAS